MRYINPRFTYFTYLFRMFETNPEVKRTFEKFREIDTPRELWHSSVLETHGMVVMNTLDEIIAGLDDEDENIVEIIVEQGRSHARFSDDFDEQTFWVKFVCVIYVYVECCSVVLTWRYSLGLLFQFSSWTPHATLIPRQYASCVT